MLAAMTDTEALEALRSTNEHCSLPGQLASGGMLGPIAYRRKNPATLVGRLARGGGKILGVPLDLTVTELETAAQACRAMAFQEGRLSAKKMENPTTRGPIESAARRYAALAEKFEAARQKG
jgi:hypothetical protein